MRRRRFLRTTSAAVCASLAGCSALDRTTEFHSPERTDEPEGAYWTFHSDGDRLLAVGIEWGTSFESGRYRTEVDDRIPFSGSSSRVPRRRPRR